jgi:UDP:flavonoid glycosyltransferase YjiC (YdhE family)
VEERGVGVVVKSFGQIVPAVRRMLDPQRYAGYRRAVEAMRNSAVFEIADMIERVIEDSRKSKLLAS